MQPVPPASARFFSLAAKAVGGEALTKLAALGAVSASAHTQLPVDYTKR